MSKKGKKARQRARRQAARQQARKPESLQPTGAPPEKPESPTGEKPPGRESRPAAATQQAGSRSERLARREAARQAKVEAARRRRRQQQRKKRLIGGLVALVVLSVAAFFIVNRITSSRSVAEAREAAGCGDLDTFEPQAPRHIDSAGNEERVPYETDPPTSGDHLGARTADWGFYTEPIEPEIFVHNLEHGGTVVHYGDLSEEQLDELETVMEEFPDGAMAIPNEELDKPVVMTAWGAMLECDEVSPQVVRGFVRERCNDSPERVSTC